MSSAPRFSLLAAAAFGIGAALVVGLGLPEPAASPDAADHVIADLPQTVFFCGFVVGGFSFPRLVEWGSTRHSLHGIATGAVGCLLAAKAEGARA